MHPQIRTIKPEKGLNSLTIKNFNFIFLFNHSNHFINVRKTFFLQIQ